VNRHLNHLYQLMKAATTDPRLFAKIANSLYPSYNAYRFSHDYRSRDIRSEGDHGPSSANPLWDYFQSHNDGRGIWKWEHYFDIYHRHFARFVGRTVDVLEIGIYSGGSLQMWRSYFGDKSHIYGVDIEEACKEYENDNVSVFIGDQADRTFWKQFNDSVQGIDILIDDGGHSPEQQQVTLEEMLPRLRLGGVYVCEDIHLSFNSFADFAIGLVRELNSQNSISDSPLQSRVSQFQSSIHSIHFYPYVVVIEKHDVPPSKLSAPKHGTEWKPFL
jgi:hypothetical protein